jgi:hypothetical protein
MKYTQDQALRTERELPGRHRLGRQFVQGGPRPGMKIGVELFHGFIDAPARRRIPRLDAIDIFWQAVLTLYYNGPAAASKHHSF